jgi:hypothetical protein
VTQNRRKKKQGYHSSQEIQNQNQSQNTPNSTKGQIPNLSYTICKHLLREVASDVCNDTNYHADYDDDLTYATGVLSVSCRIGSNAGSRLAFPGCREYDWLI